MYPGQRVICVDASGNAETCLKRGAIYDVVMADDEFICVPCCSGHMDRTEWLRRRFRPVIERKTDISIFKALLQPNNIRENV